MSILLLQKPFRSSKKKDHTACLTRRLSIWKEGDIKILLMEVRSLQSRLQRFSYPSSDEDDGNLARSFSKLMFQGKVNAALQLLTGQGKGTVLGVDDIIDQGDNAKKSVLDIYIVYKQCTLHVNNNNPLP